MQAFNKVWRAWQYLAPCFNTARQLFLICNASHSPVPARHCPVHADPCVRNGAMRPRIRHHDTPHRLWRGAHPAFNLQGAGQAAAVCRQRGAEGYA